MWHLEWHPDEMLHISFSIIKVVLLLDVDPLVVYFGDYPCLFGGLPMITHVGCLFGGLPITNVCLAEGKRRFLGNSCSPFKVKPPFLLTLYPQWSQLPSGKLTVCY